MFGWIHRAWQWALGGISDIQSVISFIRDMVHAVYGFMHTIFGHVINAWPDMWHAARNIWHEMDKFGLWVGHLFYYLYHVWIPHIAHILMAMWHYFTHLGDFAELLIWHLVASMEKHAWDISDKLGIFLLTLVMRHKKQFLLLLEHILDVVL